MTIAKTQQATGNGVTLTLNGVAAGSALFLLDSYNRATSTGVGEAVPTDTNGTFVTSSADAPQVLASQDFGVGIFHEQNAASGTHTVTPQATSFANHTLVEYSGMATSNLGDVATSGKNSGTGTSQSTGTTGSTAQAEELSLIAFSMGDTGTGSTDVTLTNPVANYTTLQIIPNDSSDLVTMHCARILSSIGTQSATFNWTFSDANQAWMAAIATFKGAGTGPDAIGAANITSSAGRFIGWTV